MIVSHCFKDYSQLLLLPSIGTLPAYWTILQIVMHQNLTCHPCYGQTCAEYKSHEVFCCWLLHVFPFIDLGYNIVKHHSLAIVRHIRE